jgi:hypothetical protein
MKMINATAKKIASPRKRDFPFLSRNIGIRTIMYKKLRYGLKKPNIT